MKRSLIFQTLVILMFPVSMELVSTYFFRVTFGDMPFGGFVENLTFYALICAIIVAIMHTIMMAIIARSNSLLNNLGVISLGIGLHAIYLLIKYDFRLDYGLMGKVYATALLVNVSLSCILILIFKNQRDKNNPDVLDG